MTKEFNKSNVQRWVRNHHESREYEEQPYRECPNCNEYKFRAVRRYGGMFDSYDTKYTECCKNCKYTGDEWTE